MPQRGQSSVEMLIAVSLVLLLGSAILFLISFRNIEVAKEARFNKLASLGELLACTINDVYLAGDGAEITLLFPASNATIRTSSSGRAVTVEDENSRIVFPLLTSSIDEKKIGKGMIRVRNENGFIRVDEV